MKQRPSKKELIFVTYMQKGEENKSPRKDIIATCKKKIVAIKVAFIPNI